jgi:RHS repeat-associated protein
MRKHRFLALSLAPSARRALSAAGLLVLALFGVCGSPQRQAAADTSGGSGAYRLEIQTCAPRWTNDHPQTNDPVHVTFGTLRTASYYGYPYPVHESGLINLDNPGSDRRAGALDVYNFDWPSTAASIQHLNSIRIDKFGNDAWCISSLRLLWRDDLIFSWDQSRAQPSGTYLPNHSRPGPIVLDDETAHARGSFVRFSNAMSRYSKLDSDGADTYFEMKTCVAGEKGTQYNVYVDVTHDGVTDTFQVPAANRDGAGDIYRLSFARLLPVYRIDQIRVRTASVNDPLCIDYARIVDSVPVVIGMPIGVAWIDSTDRNVTRTATHTYLPGYTTCQQSCTGTCESSCLGPARVGFRLQTNAAHAACASGGGSTGADTNCNGVDENCDGRVDEGYVGAWRSCGMGQCANSVQNVCRDGRVESPACVPRAPQTELCDGLDNNCNDTVDEGFSLGTACSVGVGMCERAGTNVCSANGGVMCSAQPAAPSSELCDGLDNNCNDTVDEGFQLGIACSVGVGECSRSGRHVCNASGSGVMCNVQPGTPSSELCDGKDNDCNRTVDDGFAVGAVCRVGVGECARSGSNVCNAAGNGVTCSAQPGTPAAEVCDGKDNNCNGAVDEGLYQTMTCGSGACAAQGTRSCQSGQWVDSCAPKTCADAACAADAQCRSDEGASCTKDRDCDPDLVCGPGGQCVRPQCFNGIKDPDEDKVDCGGACPACDASVCDDVCRVGEPRRPEALNVLRFYQGTFTRGGVATVESVAGRVEQARANELRWVERYDVRLGLFEGAATNFLSSSSALTKRPVWEAWGNNVFDAAGTAPDGTQTAARVSFEEGVGAIAAFQGPPVNAAGPGFTFSLFARALGLDSDTYSNDARVPLALVSYNANGEHRMSSDTVPIGPEYERLSVSIVRRAGEGPTMGVRLTHGPDNPTQGVYAEPTVPSDPYLVWGAQLEDHVFPTSYIPTTDGPASRQPDVLTFSAAQVPAWMRTGHFQIDVAPEYGSEEIAEDGRHVLLSYGSSSNEFAFVRSASVTRLEVRAGGNVVHNRVLSWERGAALTLSFDCADKRVTVFGADKGDGEQSAAGLTFPAGTALRIGGRFGGAFEAFAGISEPRQVAGATEPCRAEPSCTCGNGVVDAGEVCDVGLDARCADDCKGTKDHPDTCQEDSHCRNGQVCAKDIGANFDLPASLDLCIPAFCLTNPGNACGTPDSPCGECICTPSCAGKQCGDDPRDGCGGYCTGLCREIDVGCTRDSDCGAGFVCEIGAGPRTGKPAGTNVCMPADCRDYMPTRIDCGSVTSRCGLCPTLPNECGERQCGKDRWGHPCGECQSGTFCSESGECRTTITKAAPPAEIVPGLESVPTSPIGSIDGSYGVSDRGTATYRIPIEVPPGRAGLQPAISLNYDSGLGDSNLAKGWSLGGLSAITRCARTYAQNRVARAVQFGADAFCLDGQQLFPIKGINGEDGTEYRTEVDTFQRVISRGNPYAGNVRPGPYQGPESFEVHTKAGHVLHFGRTANARIETTVYDQPDFSAEAPIRVSWMLDGVTDASGNQLFVRYESFDASVDHDASDDRAFDQSYTAELRPTWIIYGPQANVQVRFFYGKRDEAAFFQYPRRFTAGVGLHASEPLERIVAYVDGEAVRTYRLETEFVDGDWRMNSVQLCAGESTTKCFPKTEFAYHERSPMPAKIDTDAALSGHLIPSRKKGCDSRTFNIAVFEAWPAVRLDANGDGLDDIYHLEHRGVREDPGADCFWLWLWGYRTSLSTGSSSGGAFVSGLVKQDPVFEGTKSAWLLLEQKTSLPISAYDADFDGADEVTSDAEFGLRRRRDFTGDGTLDVVRYDSKAETWLYQTENQSKEIEADIAVERGEDNVAVDLDGDGKFEVLVGHDRELHAVEWNGLGLRDRSLGAPAWMAGEKTIPFKTVVFLDANGDGLLDVVKISRTNELSLHLGTGKGFTQVPQRFALPEQLAERFESAFVMDRDGDGRAEIYVPRSGAGNNVWVQITPPGLGAAQGWRIADTEIPYRTVRYTHPRVYPYTAWNWQKPTVIDWDGNGVDDLILRSGPERDPVVQIWPGPSRLRGLLKAVREPSKRKVVFEYGEGVKDSPYTKGPNCGYPTRCPGKLPHPVVKAYEVQGDAARAEGVPGVDNFLRRFELSYEDARIDVRGRGWLGFKKQTVREVKFPGMVISETTNEFNLDDQDPRERFFPGAGHPWKTTVKSFVREEDGASVGRTRELELQVVRDWEVRTSLAGRPWVALKEERTYQREDGVLLGSSTRALSYDGHGNVTSDSSGWSDNRAVTTVTTYHDDAKYVDKWLVGLPDTVEVWAFTNVNRPIVEREFKSIKHSYRFDDQGRVKRVERNIGTAVEEATDYGYTDENGNDFGLVTSVTRSGRGAVGDTLTITYDQAGQFPISAQSESQDLRGMPEAQFDFEPEFGQMTWSKAPDGSWQTWNYDSFGRLGSTVSSTGSRLQTTYDAGLRGAFMTVFSNSNDGASEVVDINSFGLPSRTATVDVADATKARVVDYGYDAVGRPISRSLPHFQSEKALTFVGVKYDDIGRVIEQYSPRATYDAAGNVTVVGNTSKIAYTSRARATTVAEIAAWNSVPGALWAVVTTDAAGYSTTSYQGMRGLQVATHDANKNLTTFEYGPFDHLKKRSFLTIDASLTTDELGRVLRVETPAAGVQTYERDGLGRVRVYKNNNERHEYDYDALGRLIEERSPDGVYTLSYDGDGSDLSKVGHLVTEALSSSTIGSSRIDYAYDPSGSGIGEVKRTIGGEPYTTNIEYDDLGRLSIVRYPAAGTAERTAVHYQYGKQGRLEEIHDLANPDRKYWASREVGRFGEDVEVELLNGVRERQTLEWGTGRLRSIDVLAPGGALLQRHAYSYDSRGLMGTRDTLSLGASEVFTYDALGRLKTHKTGATTSTYDYDAHGNLLSKPGVGTLTYGDADNPYALTATADGDNYGYDGTYGRQVLREGVHVPDSRQELEYTSFDLPAKILQGPEGKPSSTTAFEYDSGNARIQEVVTGGPRGGTRVVHAGGAFERRIREGEKDEFTVRIPTPTGAMIELELGANPQTRVVHTDALGSSVGVSDAIGAMPSKAAYEPFGLRSGNLAGVRAGFTGHDEDAGLGLVNMRGRMYDPRVGRFLTVDPVVQSPLGSQSWNSYSYVQNSPLNFVDPSGFNGVDTGGSAEGDELQPGADYCFDSKCTANDDPNSESYEARPGSDLTGGGAAGVVGAGFGGAAVGSGGGALELGGGYGSAARETPASAITAGSGLGGGFDINSTASAATSSPFGSGSTLSGVSQEQWDTAFSQQVHVGEDGSFGRQAFNGFHQAAFAISKMAVTGGAIRGASAIAQVGMASWESLNLSYSWVLVRARIGLEHSLPSGTPVHHWLIPQGGNGALSLRGLVQEQWGRFVPNVIRNARWNLMLPPVGHRDKIAATLWHNGIHGRGAFALGLAGRLWHGSPGWAKAAVLLAVPGFSFAAGWLWEEGLLE